MKTGVKFFKNSENSRETKKKKKRLMKAEI